MPSSDRLRLNLTGCSRQHGHCWGSSRSSKHFSQKLCPSLHITMQPNIRPRHIWHRMSSSINEPSPKSCATVISTFILLFEDGNTPVIFDFAPTTRDDGTGTEPGAVYCGMAMCVAICKNGTVSKHKELRLITDNNFTLWQSLLPSMVPVALLLRSEMLRHTGIHIYVYIFPKQTHLS